MTTRYVRPRASVEIVGQTTVIPAGGTVGLDALGIPYGSASVEVPRTVDLELEDMDPRVDTRVIITGADDEAGTSRPFNLGLRDREIIDNGRRVLLTLATDEALLKDYSVLAVDTGALAFKSSLRGIVNYVLGKIGAHLEAGGPDFPFIDYPSNVNRMKNTGSRTSSAGWIFLPGSGAAGRIAMSGVGTIPSDPDIPFAIAVAGFGAQPSGVGLYNVSGNNVGSGYECFVTAGERIYCRAWIRYNGAVSTRLSVQFNVGGAVSGPVVAVAVNTWTLLSFDTVVPSGATVAGMFCYTTTASGTNFNVYLAGPMIDNKPLPAQWFDGDVSDSALWRYDWEGAVETSNSLKTVQDGRAPEMLTWNPGVSAWEFLEPLTSAAGFRLYCDELRRWFLIDPSEHTVPGVVTLAGFNVTDGSDKISREDPELFATGVVVRYRWPDATTGAAKVAYDVAGTPSKVVLVDYARPYPGAGAASAILSRRSGTGRTQSATALHDWTATPGMEASLSLPASGETRGKVASVQWSLGDDGLMDVGTRGLIDILPGTVDALVGTVDGLVGTVDSL